MDAMARMEDIVVLEGQRQPPPATFGRHTASTAGRWVDGVSLAVIWLVSVASLAGFATFALNPERLSRVPGAAEIYGRMFALAPRVQILLAVAVLAVFLVRYAGARWLGAFAALYLLSLGSELAGTTVGLPFGPYRYTELLGVKLFGHVPALIPASWFFMALPSYAVALRRWPGRADAGRRILVGSLVLLSWDLALDPAMSLVTKYWIWGTAGPYYGMPLLNLVGWYTTGLALMAALAALRADGWVRTLPLRWLVLFYGANLVLPLGMSLAAGLRGAVLATVAALLLCGLATRAAPAPARRSVAP